MTGSTCPTCGADWEDGYCPKCIAWAERRGVTPDDLPRSQVCPHCQGRGRTAVLGTFGMPKDAPAVTEESLRAHLEAKYTPEAIRDLVTMRTLGKEHG